MERFYASLGDIYNVLNDGRIDAISTEFGGLQPAPGLVELLTTKEIRVIGYDKALMDAAGIGVARVPKGSFPGVEEEDIWGEDAGAVVIFTSNRMPEDVVYLMAKSIHENLEELSVLAPFAKQAIADPTILAQDLPIVYHVGAVRYWEEVGLWGR
jgi:TRAP-type uncharacterized transport system substrate-binding protein